MLVVGFPSCKPEDKAEGKVEGKAEGKLELKTAVLGDVWLLFLHIQA